MPWQRLWRNLPVLSKHRRKESSEQLLLAEYQLIRELRESAFLVVEGRVKFVVGLLTADIALTSIVGTRGFANSAIMLLIIALGIPTTLLTYIAYLRAVDLRILNCRYLRAINAIRRYFSDKYPTIDGALRLPVDPMVPRMGQVGEGSSMAMSTAASLLILVVMILSVITAASAWLVMDQFMHLDLALKAALAASIAALLGAALAVVEMRRMRDRLRRAEIRDQERAWTR